MKINRAIYEFIIYIIFVQIISAGSVLCPIDHTYPKGGTFSLEYEFGAEYQPDLPTIIIISDSQQFYVRKGNIANVQKELFGESFNVLGIVPRSINPGLRAMAMVDGEIDWKRAYNLFSSFQLANDIEHVRKTLLSESDSIYLYGQSGGAYLITEYLSLFPETPVKKVFIAAVVNPAIQRELSILHDDFTQDFLSKFPMTDKKLENVLNENHYERRLIASMLQRQNFFIPRKDLFSTRIELIDKLFEKDDEYIALKRKEYQVEALDAILDSDAGIPIRVRIFEFIKPLLDLWSFDSSRLYPDLENSLYIADPLIKAGIDIKELFSKASLRKFQGEVFILSGRYDHIADYRASIYLSGIFQHSKLLIVDDDHMFASLKSDGSYSAFIREFFEN